jgi:ubiquinone/menaquinone biosynthesis C-methylase UbiE
MTQNREQTNGTLVQQMFGPQAGVYAQSKVHISDDSLESIQKLTGPDFLKGTTPYRWAVDIGTGAGFTAFAMSGVSERVIASDITQPMLRQARRIGNERGLGNLLLAQNAAESLPFADCSLDLITSRKAAHHFRDFEAALDEITRALKPGGSLVMADTVAPEDDAIVEWMNDIELRRDFSHVEDRKVSVIRQLLEDRGFEVIGSEDERVYLWFNDWVMRTKVPKEEVTALRREFQEASRELKAAFQVGELEEDGDFLFSFPVWVFRAVKG